MINVMEEKLIGQKKRYKEKIINIKQRASLYKKQLQAIEKGLINSSQGDQNIKKIEGDRFALLQKNKELESTLEEMKKKHLISLVLNIIEIF